MTWQEPGSFGETAPEPPPFALPYGYRGATRPGIITATGVMGIILAILGVLTALYEATYALMFAMAGRAGVPPFQWQTEGTSAVRLSAAGVGLVLAAVLLIGSIALLRVRPWSRRILLWWTGLYLCSIVVFLILEILVIVPAQVAMFANMMKTMPMQAAVVAGGAAGGAGGGAGGAGVTSSTMPTTASINYSIRTTTVNGVTTTVVTGNPMAGGPPPAQMGAMMGMAYTVWAFFKAVVCLIFPVAMLIVLNLKSVRAALVAAQPPAG
jgi:hypothetical protein